MSSVMAASSVDGSRGGGFPGASSFISGFPFPSSQLQLQQHGGMRPAVNHSFNSGNLALYREICKAHNTALSAQLALVQNERNLLEKINILCLMEFIFSRSSENRTIPMRVIAEQTNVSVEDVEYLLMKCLSARHIEGIIDQVDGVVHVSWVQPRVLGIDQVKSLHDRLDTWIGKVNTTLLSVEAETADLLSS